METRPASIGHGRLPLFFSKSSDNALDAGSASNTLSGFLALGSVFAIGAVVVAPVAVAGLFLAMAASSACFFLAAAAASRAASSLALRITVVIAEASF